MNIQIYDIAVIPVITGLVEIAKMSGLPTKFAPVLSLVLGSATGFLLLSDGDIKKGLVVGIACGLAASGLYDNIKIVAKKEG